MAMHKIGKLSFDASKKGLAFRFGDGELHRLRLGRKNADDEYDVYDEGAYPEDEGYDAYDDAPQESRASSDTRGRGYRGRFDAPSDDADDYNGRYDQDYEDDYDDNYNNEADYEDDDRGGAYDDYEDGQYDDRYDDGYDSDSYDDRYSDEDARGGYEDYSNENPILRYIDEHDWVTYVLLVLLPPLGIYLLWRRNRFERPLRWAISIASAIWFVIMLILIISAIRSGSKDTTVSGPISITTPTPTVAAETTFAAVDVSGTLQGDVSPTSGTSAADDLLNKLTPDATPIAGSTAANTGTDTGMGTGTATTTLSTVYMTATGTYYHQTPTCSGIEAGALVSTVTESVAVARGKAQCPICFQNNQAMVWATTGGKYYHSSATCSGMTNANQMTEEAAKAAGKSECPVCITHSVNSLSASGLKFATASSTDKSGITVYATANGKYFHTNATCSGMTGAASGSLLKALAAGKTACKTCCPTAGKTVYCTKGGTYYHANTTCSGMQGAVPVTLAEAMVLGKKGCPTCIGKSGTAATTNAKTTDETKYTNFNSGTVYVYGTKNGNYYHTNSTCSGMQGATRYTLKSMILAGRKACPTCCKGATSTVYASDGGKYYHSYATCSGMTNAKKGTLAQALGYGYKRCPGCWKSGSSTTAAVKSETKVYCTQTGQYYHTKKNCSGMRGADHVSLSEAVKMGKKACPTCAAGASRTVYSTKTGQYYHATKNCSGMEGAKKRTMQEAKILGQSPCPVCMGSKTGLSATQPPKEKLDTMTKEEFAQAVKEEKIIVAEDYKSGTSGIKVYATVSGKKYHTNASCAGEGAVKITLETALNYGKSACTKCAASAETKVYAVKGSKYYHYSKACAGTGAVSGERAVALAMGAEPCPYCVTKTKTVASSTGVYKSGKSGIKVYASLTGKYFHTSKTCAGVNASVVTLETALNYSKKPCPSCAASAGKTVYVAPTGKYYHSSKTCAGSGAKSGSFAKALALGLKECPVCIGGSEAYEISDVKYSAPADTSVYIDISGDLLYYHRTKKCSSAGMKSGQRVTLDYVLDWGYKACPYCAPPTSIQK